MYNGMSCGNILTDNKAENIHSKGSMKNIMVEGKNLSISINLGAKNRDEKGLQGNGIF